MEETKDCSQVQNYMFMGCIVLISIPDDGVLFSILCHYGDFGFALFVLCCTEESSEVYSPKSRYV